MSERKTYLFTILTKLDTQALTVEKGVAVKFGGAWLASKLSKLLTEDLLIVDVEILVAEEDDSALGDSDGKVFELSVITNDVTQLQGRELFANNIGDVEGVIFVERS